MKTTRRDRKRVKAGAELKEAGARPEWVAVAVVLVVALALKAAYLTLAYQRLPTFGMPIIDSAYYDAWAMRVASGEGYGASPFYLAPLYPYFLALLYRALGHGYVGVYVVQAALGLVSLLLVYLLGRRLFGHGPGLAGMILTLLYAPLIMLEGKLLSETLGLTLTLAALLLVLKSMDARRIWPAFAAGAVLGLSILCRSSNLLFAVLLMAWLAFRALRGRDASRLWLMGGLTAGLAVSILPVTIRNYVVGHDLVLIQTNLGMTFAQGNNENAKGVISHPPGTSAGIASQQAEEMAIAARELGHPVKPSQSSSWWFRRSLGWMQNHPRDAAVLIGRKMVHAFSNREEQDSFETGYEMARIPLLRLLFLPFSIVFALALIGAAQAWRSKPPGVQVLAMYAAAIMLTLIIFYVSSRYRVLCVPVLAVLAGYGLMEAARFVRERAVKKLALVVALLVGATALGQVPYPMAASKGGFVFLNVAARYQEINRLDKAAQALSEGLRASPESTELHGELGLVLARMGYYEQAVPHYQAALRDYPNVAQLHLNLANALHRLRRHERAEEHWQKAIELNPDTVEAYVNRGASRFSRGLHEEAIRDFTEAVRCAPNDPVAHNSLGVALLQSGRTSEGIDQLRRAVNLRADYASARYNLARALASIGGTEEAIREYQQLLRMDPENPRVRQDLQRLLSTAPTRGTQPQ